MTNAIECPKPIQNLVEKLAKETGVVAIYGYGPYFQGDLQARDLFLMVLTVNEDYAWGVKNAWYWGNLARVEGRKVYIRAEADDPSLYEQAEPLAVLLWKKELNNNNK